MIVHNRAIIDKVDLQGSVGTGNRLQHIHIYSDGS